MKIAERIVIVLLLLIIVCGSAWIYFAVTSEQQEVRDAVARGEYEIREDPVVEETTTDDWRRYYPVTTPITIGRSTVLASIAETVPERIKGLSDTPFLPENVVKLFVFGTNGRHSIWMKDMQYSLDIMWATKEGEIVHIEENVTPETYPESFASPTPAWYVVEANAGFVEANNISLGDTISVIETE